MLGQTFRQRASTCQSKVQSTAVPMVHRSTRQQKLYNRESTKVYQAADDAGGGSNPIDSAFTLMADIVVGAMPTSKREKEAYQLYRDGMSSQSNGKYADALNKYFQALRLEADAFDRSYVLYNIGLIHTQNGEHGRALEYYDEALNHNPSLPQALNNMGIIYHYRGEQAIAAEQYEVAKILFNKAVKYMTEAVRQAPGQYLDVQNWLKTEMGVEITNILGGN